MERNTKGVFFDRHKRKNIVKYKEIFLSEIKSLLPYFMEFSKDGLILPKDYPNDCAVNASNQRSIIMITYDESTFFVNNSHRKI